MVSKKLRGIVCACVIGEKSAKVGWVQMVVGLSIKECRFYHISSLGSLKAFE